MDDNPTEITIEDIDKALNIVLAYELKEKTCSRCGKNCYFYNYGQHLRECDECYFSRFPKEEREKFFRSFF